MNAVIMRAGAALAVIMLLSACLLTPGKFTSTLDVRSDRTFTFTYKGEVIATDFGDDLSKMKGTGGASDSTEDVPADQTSAYYTPIAQAKGSAKTKRKPHADNGNDSGSDTMLDGDKEAKMRAIAAALSKEQGYRSVRYMGKNHFLIDYEITSRLDHGFVFPFNVDAQAVFPFIAIELRADGKARIQAPGFANSSDKSGGMSGMGSGDDAGKALDGTFTLTTDAEIVSQNQEEGATTTPTGHQIVWKVTPLTKVAPMATVRFSGNKKRP